MVSLDRSLQEERASAAKAHHVVDSMRKDLNEAKACLTRLGPPEALSGDLEDAQANLAQARKADFTAQDQVRSCEQALKTLQDNRTVMPGEAIAARDRYVTEGTRAVVLGDVVAPSDGVSMEDRRAIEGALGELRWAVLVQDGRVLVDYKEYTLADFSPTLRRAADAASSVASRLSRTAGASGTLSGLLDAILRSVVFVDDHEAAAVAASEGLVAYTPDGYRYDRYGRKHSVPKSFCLGQAAYEMAVRTAQDSLSAAKAELQKARRARDEGEGQVQRLEASLREATAASAKVEELESSLPERIAESTRLDERCGELSSELAALASSMTELRVQQALTRKDIEETLGRLERVRRLADLPELRDELARLREQEAGARRAADAALEEVRGLASTVDSSERQKSVLEYRLQAARERAGDLGPRIADLERDLDDKRRDVREVEASSGMVVERWRRVAQKAEMSDQEILEHGSVLLETSLPASESERAAMTSRIVDIRPTVDSLKDDVIFTAEEDYRSAKEEFDKAEKELQRVQDAFKDASDREGEAQLNFRKVMQETFGRVSSRLQGYLDKFGWTGYLSVEPVQGTQFDLQIYLSVYSGVEPRPLLRNRSGGETSAVAALLTLAMVKEYRRPFYIFDEIDQSLDPANVLKLAAILREEVDRKYIIISHRLLAPTRRRRSLTR
jgi:chromosome segregation ATPase